MDSIHINQINTEKYLNWVFSQKGTTFESEKQKEEDRLAEDIQLISENQSYSDSEKIKYIEDAKERFHLMIDSLQKTKFWKEPTEHEKKYIIEQIEHEYHWRMDLLLSKLESSALDDRIVIEEEIDYHLKEGVKTWSKIHRAVIKGYLTDNYIGLACYCGIMKFAKEGQRMIESEEGNNIEIGKPLIWGGKVANLGYIMGLLADNGYIDAPRKRDGEINYNEFARKISNAFDFDGNNIGTLAKALNIENNNMNNDSKDLFKIPHIKSIS